MEGYLSPEYHPQLPIVLFYWERCNILLSKIKLHIYLVKVKALSAAFLCSIHLNFPHKYAM